MEKVNLVLKFKCPGCKENFEFDHVGEYQLVPCPICGTDFTTTKKGQALMLRPFEFIRKRQGEEIILASQPK